jgi:hypothetical protein
MYKIMSLKLLLIATNCICQDFPSTEKEAFEIITGSEWNTLTFPTKIIFNTNREYKKIPELDARLGNYTIQGTWDLNWKTKELYLFPSGRNEEKLSIKKLTRSEMNLWDPSERFLWECIPSKTNNPNVSPKNYNQYTWEGSIHVKQTFMDSTIGENSFDSKVWVTEADIQVSSKGKPSSKEDGSFNWIAISKDHAFSSKTEASGTDINKSQVAFLKDKVSVSVVCPALEGSSQVINNGQTSTRRAVNDGINVAVVIDDLNQSTKDPDEFAGTKTAERNAPSEHGGTSLSTVVSWSLKRIIKTRQ